MTFIVDSNISVCPSLLSLNLVELDQPTTNHQPPTMSQIQLLNAEAHEFSPLTVLKMQAAIEKKNGDAAVWKRLQSHEISLISKRKKSFEGSSPSCDILLKAKRLEGKIERRKSFDYCRFCKSNGESEELYASHVTKNGDGSVQCPILRTYVCPK